MSIYSGFPTRQMETLYNQLLLGLVDLLQRRLAKFYAQQTCDESSFLASLSNTLRRLTILEQNKHLEPKFSSAVTDLSVHLQLKKPSHAIFQPSADISDSGIVEKSNTPKIQPLRSIPQGTNVVYVSQPGRRISIPQRRRGESAPRQRTPVNSEGGPGTLGVNNRDLKARLNETEEQILSRMVNQYRKRSKRERKDRQRQIRLSRVEPGSRQ